MEKSETSNKINNFSWMDLLRSIWYFLEGLRAKYIIWTVILISVNFYTLVPPLIAGMIVDFFTKYQAGNSLIPFYYLVAIFGISHIISSLIRLTSKNKLAELSIEMEYFAKVKGFEKLLDLTLNQHDNENTGNKVQRIQTGVAALHNLRRLMSSQGFQTIVAIGGVIGIFLFLNPVFSFLLFLYFLIFSAINYAFYKKMIILKNKVNIAKEKASGSYYEGLSNILTIKTLGVNDTFKGNIESNEQLTKDISKQTIKIGILKWKIFQLFNALTGVMYLLLIGNGVITEIISIGSIFVYYNYIYKLIEAAGDSTMIFEELIEYKAAIGRMMPIYKIQSSYIDGVLSFPQSWQVLKIKDGYFNHGKDSEDKQSFVMENLNFEIHKGEKIGIVGHSGGGKSTFARLMLGLYALKKGTFTIGETNFYDIKRSELTNTVALVLQESEMFNLTLRENITLLRKVNENIIHKAVEIAQLSELVAKLPNGLDTLIGEKGYRVSGGERQRIGIARAICKNPQILVLDEATSSLDSKTEAVILQSLENELRSKTIISIAHRLSTLKNVDKIMVFEKGKIVEQGNYNDLIKDKNSKFYHAYQLQQHLVDKEIKG